MNVYKRMSRFALLLFLSWGLLLAGPVRTADAAMRHERPDWHNRSRQHLSFRDGRDRDSRHDRHFRHDRNFRHDDDRRFKQNDGRRFRHDDDRMLQRHRLRGPAFHHNRLPYSYYGFDRRFNSSFGYPYWRPNYYGRTYYLPPYLNSYYGPYGYHIYGY